MTVQPDGGTLALRIGDRVAYSAEWLNATQQHLTLSPGAQGWLVGGAAFARGVIVGDNNTPLLAVQWDGEPEPRLVLDANLCRADRIHLDAVAADAERTRRALQSLQIEDDIIRSRGREKADA